MQATSVKTNTTQNNYLYFNFENLLDMSLRENMSNRFSNLNISPSLMIDQLAAPQQNKDKIDINS